MLASIHLADLRLRTARSALRAGPDPDGTPGLRYARTMAAAPLGGSVFAAPQPRRIGLVAFWDDDAALDDFLAGHRLADTLAGGWHARLAPVQIHDYHRARGCEVAGSWPGLTGDEVTDPARRDAPVVVLTLARTRPSQTLRFVRAGVQAARPLSHSPGLIWASALAHHPTVATLSFWASPEAVEAYAYGSAGSGHRRAMAADQKRPFHHAGAFFRFHPLRSSGHLDGRNPLPADWMTAQLGRDSQESPAGSPS